MQSTAEQLQTNQNFELDRHERLVNDTTTWLAEALHGSMQTSFEYRFEGQELYGEDGGSLGEVFDDAIDAAQTVAQQNPNLLFELRRRLIERGEYDDMLRMARGELPNTMVVVSDFPPELLDAAEDVGGYNSDRKQTMLRIIMRQQDGSIRMTTQSLDRSNRMALEAIYGRLGESVEPGEMLEQRIHRDLPADWQENIASNLTQYYDESLAKQYGGSWYAGIRQTDERQIVDTYKFACSQTDLVEMFVQAKLSDPQAAEKLRFKIAATAHERYEHHVWRSCLSAEVTETSYRAANPNLIEEIELAARHAARENRTFSGCGASVSHERSLSDQLSESGYGNKTDKETDYSFSKKMHCVVCQPQPKKGEDKKMCGPCGICRSCDKKLSV